MSARSGETPAGTGETRFPSAMLYQAARLYYLENATQAQVARELGTSRTTVSRLLAQARSSGVVHIEVRNPEHDATVELQTELCATFGLRAAYVTTTTSGMPLGSLIGAGVAQALRDADLHPGDVLLVSSGATVHAATQQLLPSLHGVFLCPTVGGLDEPEVQYQTNEIARAMALKVHGTPVMLYAPAMPSPALHAALQEDPLTERVINMWKTATAALLGIGGPPAKRSSLPSVLALDSPGLVNAVGDICARPFDISGAPIEFPGSERLFSMQLEDLLRIPHTIGVAIGSGKVVPTMTAIRAGYVNTLVTDTMTARLLLAHERGQARSA